MTTNIVQFKNPDLAKWVMPPKAFTPMDYDKYESRYERCLEIIMANDFYSSGVTVEWALENLLPAVMNDRCRILTMPDGVLFFTWLRAQGMALIRIMAGETPTLDDWQSDQGCLWCHDYCSTNGLPANKAARAIIRSIWMSEIGEVGERMTLARRFPDDRDDRIGSFIISVR